MRFGSSGTAPMQPAAGANPFDQSSLVEDVLKGGEAEHRLIGDDRGDVLSAQAAPVSGRKSYGPY
jgi:hypothetical protein